VIGESGDAAATRDQGAESREVVGRRDVLFALIGACSGVLAYASVTRTDLRSNSEALGEWLHSCGAHLFSDLNALRRLGALYLVAHPEECSRAVLSQLLIADDGEAIQSQLLSAVTRDWFHHHVAVVDGWLLARTEARLCAALHLESGAGT
jgi:hypothetical protein